MAKKTSKKGTRAATAAKRAKAQPAEKGGRIPLKKICQELGLDPKASRVRLRRAWRRDEDPAVQFHTKGSRWDLTPKEAKEVRAILAG
jgi:hypothetical protein